jgi:hypothetical protein
LTVSPRAWKGWRRTKLADGKLGYLPDDQVHLEAAAPASPTAAPPVAWPALPSDYVSGRAATPEDVAAGRAVFSGGVGSTPPSQPLPVVIPQYATCVAGGRSQPGVIIQAENAYGMDVVGFRPVSDGRGVVAELRTCKLLGQTPPGP